MTAYDNVERIYLEGKHFDLLTATVFGLGSQLFKFNWSVPGLCPTISWIFTLRAKLSGAVYCYRSCLCVCNGRAGGVCLCVCLWVCYHDNSKLHPSILTKLGL